MPKQTFFNLAEDKRARILEIAIEEFADKGYKMASISNIVARAGIAKGSFYQYFENKDDLYCHIISTMIADRKISAYEQEKGRLEDLSLTGYFRVVFHLLVEEFQKKPLLMKIANELPKISGEPVYQKIMESYQDVLVSYFIPYIQHEIDQGEIDPKINIRMLNFMLLSLSQYLLHRYEKEGVNIVSSELLDGIVDDLEYILSNGIYSNGTN
ncbi:TetR family transcriptional regulator [Clostridia bacterium]|nr:TetR family transcriptional regulator [Clostridia bacterium]